MSIPDFLRQKETHVAAVITAVTLLTCVGFWFFPWLSDDLNYRLPFKGFFLNGDAVTFSSIWEQLLHRHYNDNSRLANVVMTLIIFTPKIVQQAICALFLFGTLWLPLLFTRLQRSVTAAALWVSAYTLIMPWVDQMYIFDVQINYLWSGTLASIWMWMFLQRRGGNLAFALLSLLVGAWQEATGFPIFVGMIAVMAFSKEMRDSRSVIAAACLVAGLAWLYLSPGGMKYRSMPVAYFAGRSNIVTLFVLPTVIYVAWLVIRALRRRQVSTLHILLSVSSVTSAAVSLYSLYGPRVGWWAVMSAVIGLVALTMNTRPRRWLHIAAGALLIFTTAHLIAVDYYSYREGRLYDEAVSQYRHDPESTMFLDMTLREQAPLITLQKPYFGTFSHNKQIDLISEFFGDREHPIKVVPLQLNSYREGMGHKIAGNRGVVEYEGYMVAPEAWGEVSYYPMYVSYDEQQQGPEKEFFSVAFTDADGIERSWVALNAYTLQAIHHPIPARIDTIP